MDRRTVLGTLCGAASASLAPRLARAQTDTDPFGSMQWPALRREFLGTDRVVFDPRVQVQGPAFAEDPMNVPISVAADGLAEVERITVIVDRNPIRKVLEYFPLATLPRVSFRFKLEQASPVRAAVRTRDGVWHVGGVWVDSAGGGCTAAGETRRDGSWARTLGEVNGRVFPHSAAPAGSTAGARLRLRVMHPMDTGLVGGIPAFYVNRLSLRDGERELLRLNAFEPLSENPVFSFDFAGVPHGRLQLVGTDNNGNRIAGSIE
ncbi:quinoprotein dehydrogenase-associated SoxYZ-like carrier [Rhizobacter sp. Root404]|uniref:quinoprotein dehydrogenase-associated SoxYZ-like carrier n=1 Tax=Rhizobacter sp. Root404 TaxID=1736528 RepID=UPI0006F59677|nr:quinoprotein dehydrogenase-associated SoxYZ-like carrier [Rhizobacter sp. Root404]KQW40543.1 quinoprotein dehydrogenase-associated SoxYZ-like carrier [Rhizobacter sp. Root404]